MNKNDLKEKLDTMINFWHRCYVDKDKAIILALYYLAKVIEEKPDVIGEDKKAQNPDTKLPFKISYSYVCNTFNRLLLKTRTVNKPHLVSWAYKKGILPVREVNAEPK